MDDFRMDKSRIKRVLVIKPRAIGDVLLSTSVLPGLRRAFPSASIDFLVEAFAAPVLEGNPFIDNVLSYNTAKDSSVSIISRVRGNNYNLVIDLFANPRTAVITRLSGARYRVGFPFKWRRYAYNIIVTPRSGDVHNVEFNLDALRRIGIEPVDGKPSFSVDEYSRRFAESFFEENNLRSGEFFAINIGGGWDIKRWPVDKFIELCTMIDSRLGKRVVVLYGPSEEADASRISSSSNALLAPQTTLKQMGAILTGSALLITNDSGPMHVAAALGVPTLAIFGPTSPGLQGPYGNVSVIVRNEQLDCLECNLTRCPIGNPCMKELNPETVFESLSRLINKLGIEEQAQAVDLTEREHRERPAAAGSNRKNRK